MTSESNDSVLLQNSISNNEPNVKDVIKHE